VSRFPADDGGVVQFDEELTVQLLQFGQRVVGSMRRAELPDGDGFHGVLALRRVRLVL
jgi:hypothetical protein